MEAGPKSTWGNSKPRPIYAGDGGQTDSGEWRVGQSETTERVKRGVAGRDQGGDVKADSMGPSGTSHRRFWCVAGQRAASCGPVDVDSNRKRGFCDSLIPVSSTFIVLKTTERLQRDRAINYLEVNKLMIVEQHGLWHSLLRLATSTIFLDEVAGRIDSGRK